MSDGSVRAGKKALRAAALVSVCLGGASVARADAPDPAASLEGERDALLDAIAQGRDPDGSVKRFAALLGRRAALVAAADATARAAREGRVDPHGADTLDDRIDREGCEVRAGGYDPHAYRLQGFVARVVRRGQARLEPKNDLDPGEEVPVLELTVGEAAPPIHVRAAPPGPLAAARVGDEVFVCVHGTSREPAFGEWGERLAYGATFGARIAAPPTVLAYRDAAPEVLRSSDVASAIRQIRWRYKGRTVFLRATVREAVGAGRWRVESGGEGLLVDAPPSTKGAARLQPGRTVWLLATGGFDPTTRQLLLRASAVEEHLVVEKK